MADQAPIQQRDGLYLTIIVVLLVIVIAGLYLAVTVASEQPNPPRQNGASSISLDDKNRTMLNLTYIFPTAMKLGDSTSIQVHASWSGAQPAPKYVLHATLSTTDNCSVRPIAWTQQALPSAGMTNEFAWSIAAKEVGQCLITFGMQSFNHGVPGRGSFYSYQVTINKPFDFVTAFQPYGTALITVSGSVLGAFFGGRMSRT